LQHFPLARNGVQKYLPLLPFAIEQLDLREYDIILSSSHAVAKGVITSPYQTHICYCHTPMRYAWELTFEYLQDSPMGKGLLGGFTRYILHQLRQWDVISANRVDYFLANSQHTAKRIWRCYRRPATVIYPPVDIQRFSYQAEKEDFYVTVSRLVSYKQISLMIEAFNQLQRPLVIIGNGPQFGELKQQAKGNIQLLGTQPNAVVEDYLAKAKAFVYAACEDFGIALVEAQACGTPVIAYGAGGAKETVKDIRDYPETGTGLLFSPQTASALVEAVKTFEGKMDRLIPENIYQQASQFSPQQFHTSYLEFLEKCDLK
jgi:glycosyltransferase involved in cell wall biosynthesis